jgi:fucose permease
MDMYCSSKLAVSAFGSVFFLGYALGSVILRYINVWGRKPALVIGAFYTVIGLPLTMFITNMWARYALIFCLGLSYF